MIGCGTQAGDAGDVHPRSRSDCRDVVVAYCRTERNLTAFCRRVGAEPAESNREAAEQDIVVTITSSTRSCASRRVARCPARSSAPRARTNRRRASSTASVLERATFVCCDWKEQARLESADLIEPIQHGASRLARGARVARGRVGRAHRADSLRDDIVVFKSNGIAAWDVAIAATAVERARDRKVGTNL